MKQPPAAKLPVQTIGKYGMTKVMLTGFSDAQLAELIFLIESEKLRRQRNQKQRRA